MIPSYKHALIVGAGSGLSASLARVFAGEGLRVTLAARSIEDLAGLCRETGAQALKCDAGLRESVEEMFATLDTGESVPDLVVYNPSSRVRGPFVDVNPDAVADSVRVTALGAFYVAQQAAKRMVPQSHGAILLTGASAGVKGYPQSASFAMGKFALRGLAQSMARELHPQGIHVAHFVIDGGIRNSGHTEPADAPDSMLDPDAIARSYLDMLRQDRSIWSWEIELRPWVERF